MIRKVACLTASAALLAAGTASAKPNRFYDVSSESATYTTGYGCTGGLLGRATFGTDTPNWLAGTVDIRLNGARPNTVYDTYISTTTADAALPCTNTPMGPASITTNKRGSASGTFSFSPLTVPSYAIFLLVAETSPDTDRGTLTSDRVVTP